MSTDKRAVVVPVVTPFPDGSRTAVDYVVRVVAGGYLGHNSGTGAPIVPRQEDARVLASHRMAAEWGTKQGYTIENA